MLKKYAVALLGAIIGGTIGVLGFAWFLSFGFHALVLPGGLMGIGASAGRVRNLPFAITLAVAASVLAVFAEWWKRPFLKDESLSYFLAHIGDLPPPTLLMIAVGSIVAFWGAYDPWGRIRGARS